MRGQAPLELMGYQTEVPRPVAELQLTTLLPSDETNKQWSNMQLQSDLFEGTTGMLMW